MYASVFILPLYISLLEKTYEYLLYLFFSILKSVYYLLITLFLSSFSSGTVMFPSICSTFRATLKIIPMAKQVNHKLLPPMLTNGNVTPVVGNRFTFTAIFTIACITRVKLNATARNAPNA